MKDTIQTFQRRFDEAEFRADADALHELIAEDFFSIGPKGFVLNKQEWIGRHGRFKYLEVNISEVDIRHFEKTAIVRNIQHNKATHDDDLVEITTRVMQVWVEHNDRWQIVGIQFSPWAGDEHGNSVET
jgi:hypothetical protein